jgi:hypothetical protein
MLKILKVSDKFEEIAAYRKNWEGHIEETDKHMSGYRLEMHTLRPASSRKTIDTLEIEADFGDGLKIPNFGEKKKSCRN